MYMNRSDHNSISNDSPKLKTVSVRDRQETETTLVILTERN